MRPTGMTLLVEGSVRDPFWRLAAALSG